MKLFNMSVFEKNNNSKLVSKSNNSNNKIIKFNIGDNNIKFVKKSRKLKSQKLFKS